jgi:hypothetical protein
VWVSEPDLARAKWLLRTASATHEENPPEDRDAKKLPVNKAESGKPVGMCPLCFAEFANASSLCPNCNVSLHAGEIVADEDTGARVLSDLWHPQFGIELRRALQTARIPFNNATYSTGDLIVGRGFAPNYEVLVLDADFERATRVLAGVLQHWEFEPGARFGPRRKAEKTFWPLRAAENNWQLEDLGMLLWAGANLEVSDAIGVALQEHHVAYRVDELERGTTKIFIHPEDEDGAREIVGQVVEGVPPG